MNLCNRKMNRIIITLILVCLFANNWNPIITQAAVKSDKTKAVSAYKKLLEGGTYSPYTIYEIKSFRIVYINNDDIPELVIYDEYSRIIILTFYNGEITEVYSCSDSECYYKPKKNYIFVYVDMDKRNYYSEEIVAVENGKGISLASYGEGAGGNGFTYYVKSQKSTQKLYSKIKKYKEENLERITKGYELTSENINKFFLKGISSKNEILEKGETKTLDVYGTTSTIKWTSSNKSIASVNSKGKVTAKKSGKVTITAKVGKNVYTCKVTIPDTVKLCEIVSISNNKLNYKYTSLMCYENTDTYYFENDGKNRTISLTNNTLYYIFDDDLFEWKKVSKEKFKNVDKKYKAFNVYILNNKVIEIKEYVTYY